MTRRDWSARLIAWSAPAWARRQWRPVAVVAAVIALIASAWQLGGSGQPAVATPAAQPPAAQRTVAGSTLRPDACHRVSDGGFVPTSITIPGIATDAPVLALPRDANNIPSPAPISEAGKHMFAWDRSPSPMPGSDRGNVLLNAHTWPWSSAPALGNLMLNGLRKGDRIVVEGAHDRLCYEVTRQVEIRADQPYDAYYATDGPPQLAIMVCSGERRGPGDWANRMIWFASPV